MFLRVELQKKCIEKILTEDRKEVIFNYSTLLTWRCDFSSTVEISAPFLPVYFIPTVKFREFAYRSINYSIIFERDQSCLKSNIILTLLHFRRCCRNCTRQGIF